MDTASCHAERPMKKKNLLHYSKFWPSLCLFTIRVYVLFPCQISVRPTNQPIPAGYCSYCSTSMYICHPNVALSRDDRLRASLAGSCCCPLSSRIIHSYTAHCTAFTTNARTLQKPSPRKKTCQPSVRYAWRAISQLLRRFAPPPPPRLLS